MVGGILLPQTFMSGATFNHIKLPVTSPGATRTPLPQSAAVAEARTKLA